MRKFNKGYNLKIIALIFMLIGVFLGHNFAYSLDVSHLRAPLQKGTYSRILSSIPDDDSLISTDEVNNKEIKYVGYPDGKIGGFVLGAEYEAIYKGKKYLARWIPDHDIARVRILRYLERKGVRGISKIEHFFKLGRNKGVLFEFVEGKTLAEKIGELSHREAVDIILKVARTVKALIENGVYHWDIRPDNIYITDKGEVMLMGFHSAFSGSDEFIKRELYAEGHGDLRRLLIEQAHKDRKDRTPSGTLTGKPPEDITFSPADEIFSLAVSLHYALRRDLSRERYIVGDITRDIGIGNYHPEIPEMLKAVLIKAIYIKDWKRDYLGRIKSRSSYKTVNGFIKALEKVQPLLISNEELEKAITEPRTIHIVEGHNEAYRYLGENCILINFDAHSDLGLGFIVVPSDGVRRLDRNGRDLKAGDRIKMNEINWIGHAKIDGSVKEYVHVLPRRLSGSLEELPSFDEDVIITIDYDYFALDYFDRYDEDKDARHLPSLSEIKEEVAKIIKALKTKKIRCRNVILARSPGYAASGYVKDIERELKSAFTKFFKWQDKEEDRMQKQLRNQI